ncbi:MAG TPA: glycosyltransferase [Planctomycetota bacterium]|nr:glycosyltransferase [Planctomycetota bacterium]
MQSRAPRGMLVASLSPTPSPAPSVSVAVVGICSAAHLERCLAGLEHQRGAPGFDVVVAYDPNLGGMDGVAARWPRVRLVSNAGQRNPLELASRALSEARGELILLTEDHCIPDPDWVATMIAAQAPGRAVTGGLVEIREGSSAVDWAFYFVDFFRYASPVRAGPSPTLTVCNVAYSKTRLAAIADTWSVYFHETAINDALRERFGELWLEPLSRVTMSRHVSLGDALYERYAFGRLFGCTRLGFCTPGRRLYYCIFAPVLPLLLMSRMTRKALTSRRLALPFARAILPLSAMVLCWSWGEWLGYLTRRHPRSLIVAPEIRAAQRTAKTQGP